MSDTEAAETQVVEQHNETTGDTSEVKTVKIEEPVVKPKPKRLSFAERMRIITDFQNGVIDKNYSVNINPRKAGEYIVRKRKIPIEYDIPVRTTRENTPVSNPVSKHENITVVNDTKSIDDGLRNELNLLREKYEKLSNKFKKYNDKSGSKTVIKKYTKNTRSRSNKRKPKNEYDYEYEYEYDNNDSSFNKDIDNRTVTRTTAKKVLNIADF